MLAALVQTPFSSPRKRRAWGGPQSPRRSRRACRTSSKTGVRLRLGSAPGGGNGLIALKATLSAARCRLLHPPPPPPPTTTTALSARPSRHTRYYSHHFITVVAVAVSAFAASITAFMPRLPTLRHDRRHCRRNCGPFRFSALTRRKKRLERKAERRGEQDRLLNAALDRIAGRGTRPTATSASTTAAAIGPAATTVTTAGVAAGGDGGGGSPAASSRLSTGRKRPPSPAGGGAVARGGSAGAVSTNGAGGQGKRRIAVTDRE
jgi:hypothetical protein